MMRMLRRIFVVVVSVCAAAWGRPVTAADVFVDITLRRGETHSGRIIEWTSESVKLLGDELRTLLMSEVAAIDFPAQPLQFTAAAYVVQGHGDRYAIASPRSADEQLSASWANAPLRPRLSLPLETVSGILFDLPPARMVLYEQLARLSHAPRGQDTVRFLTGDDLAGELIGMDGGLIEFDAPLGLTKLDQRRLRSLALDPDLAVATELPAARWVALLRDGSRTTVKRIMPRDDATLHLTPLTGDGFFVPWHAVSRLCQFTPELQPLSRRRPAQIDHTPFLQETAASKLDGNSVRNANITQDVNIARQPLSLRGREYVTGVGMTSRTAATYAIEPEDEAFRAIVGIDDFAGELGSATFHIDVDGVNLWSSPEVDRSRGPLATPVVELRGHQQFTLRVDFGPAGDIADIADWCDAIVLRKLVTK